MMKTINWSSLPYKVFDWWQKDQRKPKSSIRKFIAKSLRNLKNQLTNSEPKIWRKKDREGNTYFRIYDPISDRYICLNSEEEVRYWLDKHYYL